MLSRLCLLTLCFLLAACNSATIVEDRTQREAIEIVALLHGYGINAVVQRETGGRGRYLVSVDKGARSQALRILWEKGYPKESEATFNDLVAPHGLIPNSREVEALRLDRAMALELEDMLRSHPGVSMARVVVRLNYLKEKAGAEPAPASVSVMVQQKTGVELNAQDLAALAQRSIPGVSAEQVVISIQPEAEGLTFAANEGVTSDKGKVIRKNLVPFLYFYFIAEDSYSSLALTLVACLVAVMLAGAIAGYWYGYYQTSKSFFENEAGDAALKSLKFERPKKDLPGV